MRMELNTMNIGLRILAFCLVSTLSLAVKAQSSAPDDGATQVDSAQYARRLSSSNAQTRQGAAEALGRLAAVEQKKLIEGYVLQEKDKRVRLALNWALYRMGKSQTLFAIVRDLDSSRRDQAAS